VAVLAALAALVAAMTLAPVLSGAAGTTGERAGMVAGPSTTTGALVESVDSAPDPATGDGTAARGVTIVRVLPNPVATGDRGESVTLSVPRGTRLGRFTLADGEDRVRLPNRTVGGRVTLTAAPAVVRNRTGDLGAVVAVPELPALANGGERLRLRVDGLAVATATYSDAPEGEAFRPGSGPRAGFHPVGATVFPVRTADDGRATAFVLPDAPGAPLEPLQTAENRLLLAGYTLGSERVARALVAAAGRGVRVQVLVEGGPVGGLTRREARLLDRLVRAGVAVRLVGGPHARYAFHHPKYAVADDTAVVLTENWKPAGTGGHGSRGWGVTVHGGDTATALADTFRADFRGPGARRWTAVRPTHESFEPASPANESYPTRFRPMTTDPGRIDVLVAPDNAERAVVRRIDGADDSVRVLQATAGGPGQPFVRALVRAARRGVEVRLLLDNAWYAREENRAVARALNERAASEGLDLEAKLAEPRGRYGTVHAKGLVVDGGSVVVGSLNWNNHSARENREVVLAIESAAAARYFRRVFRADWRGGAWRLPVGLVVAVGLGAAASLWLAGRVTFEKRETGEAVDEERVGW
jgi:phosphatidylserine/phosphatidylglycerophosphate/cardiolipin synthase-like enzyme